MGKHPKAKFQPQDPSKTPRTEAISRSGKPVWSLGRIDFDGPWCPKVLQKEALLQIVLRLKAFEFSTWTEIQRGGSHFIDVEDIINDAQKRLQELKLDDTEQLFSLRVTGRERIWGIRFVDTLAILWWDPNHEICPSTLKHT